jgi:hypothetical protein
MENYASKAVFTACYRHQTPITVAARSKAWMSLCVYSVFVLSCVQVAALRQADPRSKEYYRLCKKIEKLKKRQGQTKDCRAIDG